MSQVRYHHPEHQRSAGHLRGLHGAVREGQLNHSRTESEGTSESSAGFIAIQLFNATATSLNCISQRCCFDVAQFFDLR